MQQDLIVGGLLGDCGIDKSGAVLFCSTNYEYIKMQYSLLKNLSPIINKYGPYQNRKLAYHLYISSSFFSRELRDKWYPKSKKIVPKDLKLNDFILAIWYMDDGSIQRTNKIYEYIKLSTAGFSKDDCLFLVEKLKDIGIFSVAHRSPSSIYYNIYIKSKSTKIFMNKIIRFIPKSFHYKIIHDLQPKYIKKWSSSPESALEFSPIIARRGSVLKGNVYDIEVEESHNFVTLQGVVHNCITWQKDRFGLGQYFRGNTEHCLFGVKGMLPYKIIENKRQQGVTGFNAKRTEHSVKPLEMRNMIGKVSDREGFKKIELFAREKFVGWDIFGNEVDSDIILNNGEWFKNELIL